MWREDFRCLEVDAGFARRDVGAEFLDAGEFPADQFKNEFGREMQAHQRAAAGPFDFDTDRIAGTQAVSGRQAVADVEPFLACVEDRVFADLTSIAFLSAGKGIENGFHEADGVAVDRRHLRFQTRLVGIVPETLVGAHCG